LRRVAALALLLASCSTGSPPSETPLPEGASPAADRLIEQAATPEERQELTAVRDRVDAEKRAEAQRLDAEIERLTRENAALRARR
jgi:outer membrane PBP1 activator LpoA protein